jgi:HD-GYP domain-containing protein (c-di-GMP phosphodiesterase class II)
MNAAMPSMLTFPIQTVDLMRALSSALDLAIAGVAMHQRGTTLICRGIAEELRLVGQEREHLLAAAFMHDVGVASYMEERMQIMDMNREARMGRNIYRHAERGCSLLRDSVIFAHLAGLVRCHHDRWDGGNPSGMKGDAIPLQSRIIHLADRADVLVRGDRHILSQREDICGSIQKESGRTFDPMVVEAFLRCSRPESFWLDRSNSNYAPRFVSKMAVWGATYYTAEEVLRIAGLYATLIDRMSAFTATHSRGVSQVAALLAADAGYCDAELTMMRIAGLLHDLGKLSVPAAILNKPAPLTQDELHIMRQHSYYTYRILEQVENFSTIALWAALHHETLDGEGYPFKIRADVLPLGARIMAAADIFVAMAEDRPYRARMSLDAIRRIMDGMRKARKIDGDCVAMLFDRCKDVEAAVRECEQKDRALRRADMNCPV